MPSGEGRYSCEGAGEVTESRDCESRGSGAQPPDVVAPFYKNIHVLAK